MKKITALLIIFSLIITNVYASGVNNGSQGTNIGDGDGNGINKGDAVTLNDQGDGIKINVGGTAATSGTKFRTTAYNVTVQTPSGTSVVTIDVDDGGATGSTINHGIDLHSNGTGTSINDLLIKAGEPSITDSLVNGEVTLVFDAVIEVYDGATGNVLGTYDKNTLGDPNADPQIPGTLYGDYTWGDNTVIELDDYFGRNIPLPKIDDPNDPANQGGGGTPTPTPTPSPSGGGGGTTLNATPVTVTVTEPTPSAEIGAGTIGLEPFDVTQGIPSGESIYADVTTGQYKVNAEFVNFTGTYEFDVTVDASVTYEYLIQDRDPITGDLLWEDPAKTNPTMVPTTTTLPYSQVVSVTKPFSFYAISQFALYNISNVEVQNGSVDSITMPTLSSPSASVANYNNLDDHFTYNNNVYAGSFTMSAVPGTGGPDLSSYADVDLFVNNDSLVLNGQVIMSDTPTKTNAPTPITSISVPSTSGGTLFSSGNTIPSARANGNYASITQVTYALSGSSIGSNIGTQVLNIPTNSVVVHTPVVSDGNIFHNIVNDQSEMAKPSTITMVLGMPTTFDSLNSGPHISSPGYGDNDYSNYISEKQVRFPFDVYMNTDYQQSNRYLKANTWCPLPVGDESFEIYLPTWVDEGLYTVEYRTIAINSVDFSNVQVQANTLRVNTIAYDVVDVEVKGRVYDFRITDINNYPKWESVFREVDGVTHTGEHYYSGENPTGSSEAIDSSWLLPVGISSHMELDKEEALSSGYGFNFQVETVGNYDGDQDAILVIPSFRYMSYDGGGDIPVDLYYHESFDGKDQYFVKIDEGLNRQNTKFMSLEEGYDYYDVSQVEATAISEGEALDTYVKAEHEIGWYDSVRIGSGLRSYAGNVSDIPAGISSDEVLRSVQQWYGSYYLPNDLYAVDQSYDVEDYRYNNQGLDEDEAFWLKEGYLIVNFDIYVIEDGDMVNPSLSYNNGLANMWQLEDYQTTRNYEGNTYTFLYGDVIMYDLGRRSSDDYNSSGTH